MLLSIKMSMEICKSDPDAPSFKHRLRLLVVNAYDKALQVAYISGVGVMSLVANNAIEAWELMCQGAILVLIM